MEAPEQRQDLVADEASLRVGVARVQPELETLQGAVLLRLGPPDAEQRADDAVGAPELDAGRCAAGDEPVEDRLDLVGRGVPRRARPVAGERVPLLAQLGLGQAVPSSSTMSAPSVSAQKRASASESAPRSLWFTCNDETR